VRSAPAATHALACDDDGSGLGFEVQYLLQAPEPAIAGLRAGLEALGDSVAVVGTGDGLWNIHVHVADNGSDIGRAIEAGVDVGRPSEISVTRLADRFRLRTGDTAVVAITAGATLGKLFAGEGVLVVHGGQQERPTGEELIAAVRASAAAAAVILPNDAEFTAMAEAAAHALRAEGVRVTVVPTRSPVQGLAAVAVHDCARRFEDDVVAMAEAAAATRYAELTYAEQDSLTSAGVCRAGDVLGLIDGEVVEIGRSLISVAFALVDRLLGIGAELMTFLVGDEASPGLGELVKRHALERAPLTEVTAYPSGQRGRPLIIGAE
jgi:dihydroxyacetone kinase-like predicted kinase